MKNLVAMGLAIAIIADVALFAGIGFGSGALSLAAAPSTNYVQTPYNLDNALEWNVTLSSYTSAGNTPTTGISSSGQSDPITASLALSFPSGLDQCNGAQNPIWDLLQGTPARTWGAWFISFDQPFTAIIGGVQLVSTGNTLFVTMNASGVVFFCDNTDGVTYLSSAPSSVTSLAFTLLGVYQPGRLTVGVVGQATNCASSPILPQPTGACVVESLLAKPYGSQIAGPDGSDQILATAAISTQSGQAYVQVTNPGQLAFNGGTLTFQTTTGYGGPAGYTAAVTYPSIRPDGGQVDSEFAAIAVPNFCLTPCSFSWPIPMDAGQNHTPMGTWNDFTVVEISTNGYVTGQATAAIDVSPLFAPPPPSISVTHTGTLTLPRVGDTVTVSVTATATNSSGPVLAINLWVYYNPGNLPPASQPPCGAYWVTSCSGNTISTTAGVATYSFVVGGPPGVTQIVIQAQSSNQQSQVSGINTATVDIAPSNCAPGVPGCPNQQGTSLWQILGPILLSAAIILSGFLGMLLLPAGPMRFILPAVAIGTVAALLLLGVLSGWFDPGGALNAG